LQFGLFRETKYECFLRREKDVIYESSERQPAIGFRHTLRIAPNHQIITDDVGVRGHSRSVAALVDLRLVVSTQRQTGVGHTHFEGREFFQIVAKQGNLVSVDLVVFHSVFLTTHVLEGRLPEGIKDGVDAVFLVHPGVAEFHRYAGGFLCQNLNGLSEVFEHSGTVGVNQ